MSSPLVKGRDGAGLGCPSLEFTDPTPDIHRLFLKFNDMFFRGALGSVELRWSKRMYSCAGICRYQKRAGFCDIALSEPLLKLRSRKDLIETLIHEMIHAYLFITANNRDRDGHGPEFLSHMYRINKAANLNISVYHTFHDEVKLYQTHWWRCEGPCQKRPPFYGLVKRSSNRAPGPNDFWWKQHEFMCGGKFIKIKEPEKKTKTKKDSKSMPPPLPNKIDHYFTKPIDIKSPTIKDDKNFIIPIESNEYSDKRKSATDIKETVRNHWAEKYNNNNKRKLDECNPDERNDSKKIKKSEVPLHVQLGLTIKELIDCNQILKDVYGEGYSLSTENFKPKKKKSELDDKENVILMSDLAVCPICNESFEKSLIEEHANRCLDSKSSTNEKIDLTQNEENLFSNNLPSTSTSTPISNAKQQKNGTCPICSLDVSGCNMELHLEKCVSGTFLQESKISFESSEASISLLSDDSDSDDENVGSKIPCPCCLQLIEQEEMNNHLDECLL